MAHRAERNAQQGTRRGSGRVFGGAAVILLLLLGSALDVLVAMMSIGTARVPLRWVFEWHLAFVLVAMVAVAWKWRERSAWLFAVAIALIPFAVMAAMMLR